MSEQKIHVFIPSMDGEYVPVKFTSPEDDLKETEVFIFLDEEERHIYIWTGSNSPVRKRFISSQIARQMRLEKGLTHKVSTEEQGNETRKFLELMNNIGEYNPTADTLLGVSPPPFAINSYTEETREIITHPSTLKIVNAVKPTRTKTQNEVVSIPKRAPTMSSAPKAAPYITSKAEEDSGILYFCKEIISEIDDSKAKILFPGIKQELVFANLLISTAASDGRIAFYSVSTKKKTVDCTSKDPILVVYIKPNTQSIVKNDDLNIPIKKGQSIFFTCPAMTFIGINLE
ncbi:MAG: hypothetical protein ACXAC8_09975 [Candidatus Hodarchaeales archaeon]